MLYSSQLHLWQHRQWQLLLRLQVRQISMRPSLLSLMQSMPLIVEVEAGAEEEEAAAEEAEAAKTRVKARTSNKIKIKIRAPPPPGPPLATPMGLQVTVASTIIHTAVKLTIVPTPSPADGPIFRHTPDQNL